jgi:uncharacterized protein YjbI with pentapeptide repeats
MGNTLKTSPANLLKGECMFIKLLAAMALMFSGSVMAFDQADLDDFLDKGRCVRCDLSGADFTGLDLSGSNFVRSNLDGANFTDAICIGCNFNRTSNVNALFTGADLTDSNFNRSDVTGADFTDAVVDGVNFNRSTGR